MANTQERFLWRDLRDAIRGAGADNTKIPLRRAVFLLAVPMVREPLLGSTFAVVDIWFVARLGPSAVATVGLTETSLFLLCAIGIGLAMGAEAGPEHVVLAADGKLYAATASGNIVRMSPDRSGQEVFVNTGGRVLGFDFDASGRLIAADAVKGLLAVATMGPDRKVTLLTNKVGGDPIRYADAVVVAKSGTIYFSDASGRFAPAQWGGTFEAAVLDIIEQACTGRILEYDPLSNRTRIMAKGFSFANGVALSGDEQTLFVAETGKYRVWKLSVAANDLDVSKEGVASTQASVLFDNLPGYPDNLTRGQEGRIWLAFSGPRSPDLDAMAGKPFLRELTLRLPRVLWPLPKRYGHVMAFSDLNVLGWKKAPAR